MTEAERLQKIVQAQERELKRLRRLLSIARVASVEYFVEENKEAPPTLRIVCTCIGVDEYHFIEKCKPEMERIAEAIVAAKVEVKTEITDEITGEPLEGGVGSQS